MPGQSLTSIIGGPAIITYRGATLRSKGDIRMNMELERFAIETSLYGQVDERVREHPLKLSFVPDGEWSNLGVLWPYALYPFGQYLTPQLYFGTINSNQVNVGSTAVLISGDAFVAQPQNSGTITNGLVAGNTYYFHVVNATNVSLHTTYANAVAGTNPIAISAGSAITVAVVNNPLTIQTIDGFLWTFANVAVSKMPNLSLSTVRTAVGEIEMSAYLADGQDWSGGNSLYTYAQNPWPGMSDSSFRGDPHGRDSGLVAQYGRTVGALRHKGWMGGRFQHATQPCGRGQRGPRLRSLLRPYRSSQGHTDRCARVGCRRRLVPAGVECRARPVAVSLRKRSPAFGHRQQPRVQTVSGRARGRARDVLEQGGPHRSAFMGGDAHI